MAHLAELIKALMRRNATPLGGVDSFKEALEAGPIRNVDDLLRASKERKEVLQRAPAVPGTSIPTPGSGPVGGLKPSSTGKLTGPGPPLVSESGNVPISGEVEPGFRTLDETLPVWEEPPSKEYFEGKWSKPNRSGERVGYPGLEQVYKQLDNFPITALEQNLEAKTVAEEAYRLYLAQTKKYYDDIAKKTGRKVKPIAEQLKAPLPHDTKPPKVFGEGEFSGKSIGEEMQDLIGMGEGTKLTSGVKRQQRFDPTKNTLSPEELEKSGQPISYIEADNAKEVARITKLLNDLRVDVPAQGGSTSEVTRIQREAARGLVTESVAVKRINMAKRDAMNWLENLEKTLTMPKGVPRAQTGTIASQLRASRKRMGTLQQKVMDGWRTAKRAAKEGDASKAIDDFEELLLKEVYGPSNPPVSRVDEAAKMQKLKAARENR
jgi:hypothetical protein